MSHFASGMIHAGTIDDGPAPTFVSVSANGNGSSAAMPSGWAVGDLLMIFASSSRVLAPNNGHDTPAGWTELGSFAHGRPSANYIARTRVFYRIAQSGESSVGLTATSQSGITALDSYMMAFRGMNASSPFEALETLDNQGAASTYPYAQITTLGSNRVVVQAISTWYSSGGASSTPYTGWAELFDTENSICVAADMRTFASAGLTSAGNQTRTSGSAHWGRMAFAIKPA